MKKNDHDITIDLNIPLNGITEVTAHSLLQIQARELVYTLLNKFLMQSEKNGITESPSSRNRQLRDRKNIQRHNNTIFINGQRGAGKTTFLQTILNDYEKLSPQKILPVAFIDPTLIETHQHILVEVVAKFCHLIDEKLKCCSDEKKYRMFHESLENMAEGLQLLRVYEDKNSNDSSWFLTKAIKKATSGQNLEHRFHDLIETVSNILDTNLFVIAIDDVDTKTSKAYEVLEVIRCYLTHPKLAILISGDLALYSYIVKNKKAQELFITEKNMDSATAKLVEHLEQQYLSKILPIEQRVTLLGVDELSVKNNIIINHDSINNGSTNLNTLIEDIFNGSLYINKNHLDSHKYFILNQPVRTILQLIKVMVESNGTPKCANTDYEPLTFKKTISNIFIGSIIKENIDHNALCQVSPHINTIGYELFCLNHKYGELETGFYARPNSKSDSYNVVSLFLSATISALLSIEPEPQKSISNTIKLMLVGGGSSNIYMNNVANNIQEKKSHLDYINYIGLNRSENTISLAAHFSTLILHQVQNKVIKSGVVRFPRSTVESKFETEKFNSIIGTANSRITTLNSLLNQHTHESWSYTDYVAAKTILISSHSASTSAGTYDYCSSYVLLAAISHLLENDNDWNVERLTGISTYGYPTFFNSGVSGDVSVGDNIQPTNEPSTINKSYINKLDESIKLWREKITKIHASSLLIGKIWSRITYTLNSVSDEAQAKIRYSESGDNTDIVLGVFISRVIWGLINSTLIEESRFLFGQRVQNISFSAKNISTSPIELINNINQLKTDNDGLFYSAILELPITLSLLSCPLFWPFLGGYIKGNGTRGNELYDLFFEIIKEHDEQLSIQFKEVAETSEPSTLAISRLPIVGCFTKSNS
ncbi:P-loop NTPase fold protein [Aeromonas dhakensis]|uniref:P-loop NTPase fold protein n=1 Tax=Aeromonas dhakensis TaxID=196024 RepID=UPI00291351D1|nr:hypothetical protein [Aeromonas dhakensis]